MCMLRRRPQVKKEITKATLARTQQTSAKKKPAKKKAAKKPAKKKAKKPKKKAKKKKKKKKKKKAKKKKKKKKKKAKKTKYPGGKRPKGVHKSKASIAAGKKVAAAMKKKGVGLFAVKTLSADLAAICGKTKMPRTEVTKALWGYIKKNKLNKGRTITPDAKLKKVLPAASSAGCAFRTDCILMYSVARAETWFLQAHPLGIEVLPQGLRVLWVSRRGQSRSDTFALPPRLSMFKMPGMLKKHIK